MATALRSQALLTRFTVWARPRHLVITRADKK